jgi:hypothetical protein
VELAPIAKGDNNAVAPLPPRRVDLVPVQNDAADPVVIGIDLATWES